MPEKPDGTFSDHGYFCIHDDLFDIIQSPDQNRNIMWGFISNEPNKNESQSETTEIHDDKIQNKKSSTTKKSTKHNIKRKSQKQLTKGENNLMN